MSKLQKKVKLHFKLPTNYNDNTPIQDEIIKDVKNYFVDLYGGLTVDSPSVGFWDYNGFVYEDNMIEYSIFIKKDDFEHKFKQKIPRQITKFKKQFAQVEILCYYHDVIST